MTKKFLLLICLTIFGLMPLKPVFAEAQTNPIDEELYNLCQIKLLSSIDEVAPDNYMQRMNIPSEYDTILSFTAPLKEPEINGIPLYRDMTLTFCKDQLYDVRLEFNPKDPDLASSLKDYLSQKLGNPTNVSQEDYGEWILVIYTWCIGDSSVTLSTGEGAGSLSFSNIPLSKEVGKIVVIQYAKMLKTDAINREYFEKRVRENSEVKTAEKRNFEIFPGYKEALADSGVDMSIFND